MTDPAGSLPAEPPEASSVFGARHGIAAAFAGLLADAGVVRGLIGPREVPSLWPRHLFNCAAVSELIDDGARVVDVGSGAGLPGIVVAIRRPDVSVQLIEPLERRCGFLREAVTELGLDSQVDVLRGRANDRAVATTASGADVVTARAVAPLERLVGWCIPLARVGGQLLAIKGNRAEAELAGARRAIQLSGARVVGIESVEHGPAQARVVRIERIGSRSRPERMS